MLASPSGRWVPNGLDRSSPVALIAAVRQVNEGGEAVTNRAVIDALMAIMEESNPRMIPTLACCEISAEEPFFGC